MLTRGMQRSQRAEGMEVKKDFSLTRSSRCTTPTGKPERQKLGFFPHGLSGAIRWGGCLDAETQPAPAGPPLLQRELQFASGKGGALEQPQLPCPTPLIQSNARAQMEERNGHG